MLQPNILFILSDQQRWDTCGCYGQPLNVTPNLDLMAREGVRFEHAFTPQPVCGPARACLQTGRYATEVGCHVNNRMLPTGERTIAHALSDAGYEAGYLGKWHLASAGEPGGPDDFRTKPVPPERRGGYCDFWLASDVLEFTSHSHEGYMFDAAMQRRDFPRGRYRADALTDFALEYLRTRDGKRPWFLFLSYLEPHHQNDHNRFEGPLGSRRRWRDFVPPGDLAHTWGDWRQEYPDYLGCCNSVDDNLGKLRDELAWRGMARDTLVIYTSDHGSHFRTRNGEYKRSCHDACIRVPLVMYGPGFGYGRHAGSPPLLVNELVSLIDLPATLLAAAGVTPPPSMRGRPVQQLVDGRADDWPQEVFLQISESQCGRAIRTARWKYSVRAPDKTGQDASSETYAEDFLYDLAADPHEQNNLVDLTQYADVRAELAETLKRRMIAAGETVPTILPAPR
jgi:arylsulfatase A-like enzyme